MNQKIKIGAIFVNRTVISEGFLFNHKWHIDVQCNVCNKISKVRICRLNSDGCRCIHRKKPVLLKGNKLFSINILGEPFYNNSKWLVKARCDCGRELEANCYSLMAGNSKTCGFCNRIENYKDISGSYWRSIQRRAENRGLNFNINIEKVWRIYELQNFKCALSEWDLSKFEFASLDRIDSKLGYIEGNVQWLHRDINKSKWNLNQDWYKTICWLVSNNNFIIKPNEISNWHTNIGFKGAGNLANQYWSGIKRRQGGSFDVSINQGWELYVSQKGRCALSNLPIYFDVPGRYTRRELKDDFICTASLDRIDSQKGYTYDNIQWLHKDVNMAKMDFSLDYFFKICESISNKMIMPNLDCLKISVNFNCVGKYKGVSWDSINKKWRATIHKDRKAINLGRFSSEEDAAKAYDDAVLRIFGSGHLNFPS